MKANWYRMKCTNGLQPKPKSKKNNFSTPKQLTSNINLYVIYVKFTGF